MYRGNRPYNPNTRREYSHSPIEKCQLDDTTSVNISARGRVIITQGNETEYDEVDLSAAQVYRIAALLNETKSVKYVTREKSNE